MIVVMKKGATAGQIGAIISKAKNLGCQTFLTQNNEHTTIGVVGSEGMANLDMFERMEGVEKVQPSPHPYELASRDFHPADTIVALDKVHIGGRRVVVMAGPCAVESRQQLLEAAQAVKEAGARILRGGAFKPRTSPYSFQGLGREGLELLAEARAATGLAVVSEVVAPEDVPLVARYVDILQVGARNMQNYALLRAVGRARRPVLLKRGMMATLEELLMAAEYIMAQGNSQVMLCERGIRTFETYTRNTLDINAVPLLKQLTHLPVIVDPSHGTGLREIVGPVSQAAVAAGADGLLIEVHPHPEKALSDGPQSLRPDEFTSLLEKLRPIARAMGREI
ncbi:MAG: 3-deoxy-7-phosphoheptulonate synthase [Anaerolineae bacterium]